MLQVTLILQCVSEAVVCLSFFRIEFDGLPVVPDGFVQLALIPQCDSEVVVGRREARVEFDGFEL